jgi:hypothetical protein
MKYKITEKRYYKYERTVEIEATNRDEAIKMANSANSGFYIDEYKDRDYNVESLGNEFIWDNTFVLYGLSGLEKLSGLKPELRWFLNDFLYSDDSAEIKIPVTAYSKETQISVFIDEVPYKVPYFKIIDNKYDDFPFRYINVVDSSGNDDMFNISKADIFVLPVDNKWYLVPHKSITQVSSKAQTVTTGKGLDKENNYVLKKGSGHTILLSKNYIEQFEFIPMTQTYMY